MYTVYASSRLGDIVDSMYSKNEVVETLVTDSSVFGIESTLFAVIVIIIGLLFNFGFKDSILKRIKKGKSKKKKKGDTDSPVK